MLIPLELLSGAFLSGAFLGSTSFKCDNTISSKLEPVALKLNLVSLTSSELERLLGQAGARQIQPDLSAARLSNRPLLWDSPFFQEHFVLWPALESPTQADPQTHLGQNGGKTPEANRRIRALQAELEQIGATFLGCFSLQQISGDRKIAAYLVPERDLALALRWSEQNTETEPALQAFSWLRQEVAGVEGVSSWNVGLTVTLEGSPQILVDEYPQASVETLLENHRTRVRKYGKATKVQQFSDFEASFERLWQANLLAWKKRGLCIDVKE
jgi:hypothetical protein